MKKASKKGKSLVEKYQLLGFVAGFIVVGIGALVVTQAQHGAGSGFGGNASISGTSACVNGVWVVHAAAASNTSRLGQVDVYATLNTSQTIKVQDQLSLSQTIPTTFDTTPGAGITDYVLYVTAPGGNPIGSVLPTPTQPVAESATQHDACNPPAPSGKGKHGA